VLEIDGDLLEALCVERFKGVVTIPDESWPFHGTGSAGPDRATLWRWRRGEAVPNEFNFLGLAGSLDVDPALLLKLCDGTTFVEFCESVSRGTWGGSWPRTINRFRFFKDVILGMNEWPPNNRTLEAFKRDWTRRRFRHDAKIRASYYARFLITPGQGTRNRVWHFAWRDGWRPIWRPYGFVIAREAEIHLYCFDGREAVVDVPTAECSQFVVETYFGPNSAEFCIASLHDFQAELVDDSSDRLPRVRFSVDVDDDSRLR